MDSKSAKYYKLYVKFRNRNSKAHLSDDDACEEFG